MHVTMAMGSTYDTMSNYSYYACVHILWQCQQPLQLGADAEEADLNIGGDPGVRLVPCPCPGAVADAEDFNVERHSDLPFTPSPQPEAVDSEQRHAVEGSPNTPLARTDTRSDVGFTDVASEVRSNLSDDRSIQTCHPEEFGLDGQSSATSMNLLTGGSFS